MTRTSAQNKALTAVEDKSLSPDYAEPDDDAGDEKPTAAAAKPAEASEPEDPKATEAVVWAQFSHGRSPGDTVKLRPEEAAAMIHAGYATAAT